jgi:cytochrome P450
MILQRLISYCRHHHRVTTVTATVKAAFSKHPLPPGRFLILDPAEQSDQKFLLKHSRQVGQIFKTVFDSKLCICVIGLPLCRRFLQEHSADVTPDTIRLEELFPKGFLRAMMGEEHKRYRKSLVRAIDPEVLLRGHAVIEKTIIDELARYAENQTEGSSPPEIYIKTLNNIASSLLIYIFFGATVGSGPFEDLIRMYNKLGPNGIVWSIGEQQKQTFFEIRDYLLGLLSKHTDDNESWLSSSIMGRMHEDGALDETSLGNLIYMVEMGRYDMHLLFRWLSKYGGDNPVPFESICTESDEKETKKTLLSEAFVLETLRLNQSERLMRVVNRDIIFDGYLIPRNFRVRLCLWESHKSPESFDEPFSFKPERFFDGKVGRDQFSPFGLHQHSCPFADISSGLSEIFIRVLARHYEVDPVADGPSVRGLYHWQPADSFSVRLSKRGSIHDAGDTLIGPNHQGASES